MKLPLLIPIILLSTINCESQVMSVMIDLISIHAEDFTIKIPPLDPNEFYSYLYSLKNNPDQYTFENPELNDQKLYNWVILDISLVYFSTNFNVKFDLKFEHIVDELNSSQNAEKTWNEKDFTFMNEDYTLNGRNRPNHVKRTYIATFLVNLPLYKRGKFSLRFQNQPNDQQKFYFKSLKAVFSKCKPDCRSCETANTCSNCNDNFYMENNQCSCNSIGFIAFPWYKGDYPIEFKCDYIINDLISAYYGFPGTCKGYGQVTPLQITGDTTLNYCNSCYSNSILRYDPFRNLHFCSCPSNYQFVTEDNYRYCKSPLEQECANQNSNNPNQPTNEDASEITNWLSQQSNNFVLKLNSFKDIVTDEDYYSVELSRFSNIYNSRLAFKLFINAPGYPSDRIENIYYNNYWLQNNYYLDNNGIYLNKNTYKTFVNDCKQSQSTASLWKCEVGLIAFHPCKNFVYMNIKIPVEIDEDGIVKSNVDVETDSNKLLLSIPCIMNNSCFFNQDYSSTMFVCEDQQCKGLRRTSFKMGETIWLRSTFIVANPVPGVKYTQSVEMAAFDLYDNNNVLQNSIPMTNNWQAGLDFANQPLLGFPIKINAEMVQGNKTVRGNAVLQVILRVNKTRLRILEDNNAQRNSNPITAPISVNIEIDVESFRGLENNNNNNSITNQGQTASQDTIGGSYLIAAITLSVVFFLCMIAGFVIYFIKTNKRKNKRKNKSKNKDNIVVPVSDPQSLERTQIQCDRASNAGTSGVHNYDNNSQKGVEIDIVYKKGLNS